MHENKFGPLIFHALYLHIFICARTKFFFQLTNKIFRWNLLIEIRMWTSIYLYITPLWRNFAIIWPRGRWRRCNWARMWWRGRRSAWYCNWGWWRRRRTNLRLWDYNMLVVNTTWRRRWRLHAIIRKFHSLTIKKKVHNQCAPWRSKIRLDFIFGIIVDRSKLFGARRCPRGRGRCCRHIPTHTTV